MRQCRLLVSIVSPLGGMSPLSEAQEQPKASPGLLRSSLVVSAFTFLSRILGLIRDVVLARFLGADANADAFIVAFKIPNFMRRLFAEGAFAQAFVPVLSEYRERGSHAAVRQLLNAVAGCLGSSLLLLTALVVSAAPIVTMAFAPGFYMEGGERYELASDMIRITFPYLLLISLTGFAGAILNSYDRFAVPAFTPVLLNICLISAAVWASPYFDKPVMALAWGIMAAGVVQLLFQLPFLYQLRLLPYPAPKWKDPGVRRILALMAPAIFGVSVSQINLLLDTVLASLLPLGSVTWLYFSDRLAELPLGVFAIAVATVILPSLSRQHSADKPQQFSATLDWAMRLVLLIAVPAALALMLLATPILTTLFQYGKYSAHDIAMAAWSLQAYSFGLVAFMLIKILAPGYFSRQDTKTPVKYGIIAMVSNMVLNIAFVWPLYTYMNLGHVGLALATSCSAFINAGLLLWGLRRMDVYRPEPGWWPFAVRMLLANLGMAAVLLYLNGIWQDWFQWLWWQRAYTMLLMVLAGLLSYVAILFMAGLRPSHVRQKRFEV